GLIRRNGASEQVPEMEIPGRGLDHKARPDRDVAALVLVGAAVGDESEHPGGVLETAALVAAPVVAHGSALDIDVVSGEGVADCGAHRVLDTVELEALRDDAFVDRIDTAQLQHALRASTVDDLTRVGADDLMNWRTVASSTCAVIRFFHP